MTSLTTFSTKFFKNSANGFSSVGVYIPMLLIGIFTILGVTAINIAGKLFCI